MLPKKGTSPDALPAQENVHVEISTTNRQQSKEEDRIKRLVTTRDRAFAEWETQKAVPPVTQIVAEPLKVREITSFHPIDLIDMSASL